MNGCEFIIRIMKTSKDQLTCNNLVKRSMPARTGECISCGAVLVKRSRRYCTEGCRRQINWVLALSKGLLKTFNVRYAAFSFTGEYVILDLLPFWSKVISRFIYSRKPGRKPAEDLKDLVLQSGAEWHSMVNNNNSKSYASLFLLQKNHNIDINPNSIKPDRKINPRLSKYENRCLKILKLERKDLSTDCHAVKINSAYKKLAKIHHPDKGGDEAKFKQLNEAHKQMLLWVENPNYTSKKALYGCWSYDGSVGRWSPPL